MKKAETTKQQIKVGIGVKQAIEDEARRLSRKGNGRVTAGDVIEEAWRQYCAAIGKASGGGPVPIWFDLAVNIPLNEIKSPDVSGREYPWVEKLLRILRSATQLSKSIQENLDGFCAGLDAMQEVQRLTEQLRVAGERHGSPDAGAPKHGDLAAGIERVGRLAGEARRTLEGAEDHGKAVRKKKA